MKGPAPGNGGAHGEVPAAGPAAGGVDAAQLWQLLQRQTLLYTGGESSSVPLETAGELLRSLCFCLAQAQAGEAGKCAPLETEDGAGRPENRGLCPPARRAAPGTQEDIFGLLRRGQRSLEAECARGRKLLERLKRMPPPCQSEPYADTVRELESFFVWYDIRFLAHQIPCMITYPLSRPVPGDLPGVHYINAFLERMLLENSFCRRFLKEPVRLLLRDVRPAWEQLPYNLFEPVFACAMACQMLGREPRTLAGTVPQAQALKALLGPLYQTPGRLRGRMEKAAADLCSRLRLWDKRAGRYAGECAGELAAQLPGVRRAGLAHLFCLRPARGG